MTTTNEKRFWDGDLYKLIVERVRGFRTPRGQFSIAAFSRAMGMSSEGLYKFLRADSISLAGAKKVIAASNGAITKDELTKFLFD